ncbi:hypothetical protein [Sphingobium algorifonticola]|uniref:Uncharacterized protein n=1 Tax=Sphingobium algorifonticola TaxID=2008318 RepID=A0A437J566_9SPHN|nr:hypothetical protein [Sphingobium algorifonticola]RVT39888.1 hypothetical protein ENE74_14220 [Sphingobium algorifonticola]
MTTSPNRNPTGAGAIIAFLAIGGVIGGGLLGQPTIGLLAGIAGGVGIAILLWWRERRRDL